MKTSWQNEQKGSPFHCSRNYGEKVSYSPLQHSNFIKMTHN